MDKNFLLTEEILTKLKDKEFVSNQFAAGKSLKEMIGFSDDMMEELYIFSRNLFRRENYSDAADAFFFLTFLDPLVYAFWLGLGMAEQKCYRYESALWAYGVASNLKMENPLPHTLSASCYASLNDHENEKACLALAKEYQHINASQTKT